MFDDGLRIDYLTYCETIFKPMFFGYHLCDLAIRKFILQYGQFVEVKCDCCKFDAERMYKALYTRVVIGLYSSCGGTVIVEKTKNGVVVKNYLRANGTKINKAPVKWLELDDEKDETSSTTTALEPDDDDVDSEISDVSFLEVKLEETGPCSEPTPNSCSIC